LVFRVVRVVKLVSNHVAIELYDIFSPRFDIFTLFDTRNMSGKEV